VRQPARSRDPSLTPRACPQAIYEKEPSAVTATPAHYARHLFGPVARAHALLALDGGAAVGLALYFFNFSTWTGRPGLYLEDLFVREERRGAGVAKALFARLALVAEENVRAAAWGGAGRALTAMRAGLRADGLVGAQGAAERVRGGHG
jgi:GNAT superfamily N-acetyltransferase